MEVAQGPQVRSPAACEEASHRNTWPQWMHSMVTGSGIDGLGTGIKRPGSGGGGPVTISSLPVCGPARAGVSAAMAG